MACGVFHKASKGFWSKVKGTFGRIGNAIKNTAVKAYNWVSNNRDKIANVAKTAADTFGGDKAKDYTNKGIGYLDKGLDFGKKIGIV